MKILYKNLMALLMIFLSILIISSCQKKDAEADDSYGFEVVSSDGSFEGYYMVDGGSAIVFSSSQIGTSIFHSFKKNLVSPTSLRVSATGISGTPSATSISIYIYAQDKEVKDITVAQTVANIGPTATLSYDFTSTTTSN